MRAARILDMLLTLQQRGRMSASRLAQQLEVSERTILRDVEALGEAGVPIFTIRGSRGGIELMDGFETRLTGLTSDEAAGLFLTGNLVLARRLGFGTASRTARRKLLEALAATLRPAAEELDSWFLHDPDPPGGSRVPAREVARLANSIRRRRIIEITLPDASLLEVQPVGLVLQAGSWHLIDGKNPPRVIPIDGLVATRLTRRPFQQPSSFSLAAFWEDYCRSERARDDLG